MKKSILTLLTGLLLSAALPVTAFAQELIVGGQAVGIRVRTEGVLVSGTAPVETAEGAVFPAAEAGLREGDRILGVNGRALHGAAELIAAVGELEGEAVELEICRGEQRLCRRVQPALSAEGQWRLGMWLRDAVTGIGTVTFCDPETGVYGALGHGLTDEELGTQVPLETGTISEAEICGVTPGSAGSPGALNGEFGGGRVLGTVDYSGSCGIYGVAERALGSFTAEVGHVQTGPASILATVDGREVREFADHPGLPGRRRGACNALGDGRGAAGPHRRHRPRDERQSHPPGGQAGGRGDACLRQRSHPGLRSQHPGYAGGRRSPGAGRVKSISFAF